MLQWIKHPCTHKPYYRLVAHSYPPLRNLLTLLSGYAPCEMQLPSIVSQRGRYEGTGNRTGDFASSSSRDDAGPKVLVLKHWIITIIVGPISSRGAACL